MCSGNCNQGRSCDCRSCKTCLFVKLVWRGIRPRFICTRYHIPATQVCIDWRKRNA